MPRTMSFMLTTEQVEDESKDVTRRNGWGHAKAGDIIQACEKCQGLGKGGKIRRLKLIQVVSVRRERLDAITFDDVRREGFPGMTPTEFVLFYCKHNKKQPHHMITRIEFKYLEPQP